MSVFPADALLDKTLWALMGLITLFLFLGAVVLFALLVRQKRYRKLWAVLPVILPSYFLYQCICTYADDVPNSQTAAAVAAWFGSVPGSLIFLTCVLLALAEGLLFRGVGTYEKTRITPMSVKEATDSLPMGICAYLPGGQIVMMNQAIIEFCQTATGNVLSDAEAFAGQLRSGSLQPGCKTVMLGETPVIVLTDDTAWALSEEILSGEKEKTRILRVSDITETYQKTLALRSIQEKVSSLNRRLAKANWEIVDLTAAQEVLNAKIKIHDELGSNLLSIRRYLQSGGSKEERAEIVGRLRRNLTFLKGEPEVPADEYDLMMETAARLDVRIAVTGKLPQTEPHKRILATAMHECLTNMLRHADGDELRITLTESGGSLAAVFTNNGKAPGGEIREKGGLASLRVLTEQAGGAMTVRSVPTFAIQLELPKEVENAL